MKILLLSLLALLAPSVSAADRNISGAERKVVKSFTAEVIPTRIAADACLRELTNKPGVQCETYHRKMNRLGALYVLVMRMDRKKLNYTVAHDNELYAAFRAYEGLQFVVLRIRER